jgi:hypothetical protein
LNFIYESRRVRQNNFGRYEEVCEHKINCAKTARKGGTLPPPPVSLDGVAAEFFNDITVATKHNQHSMAVAAENRGGV